MIATNPSDGVNPEANSPIPASDDAIGPTGEGDDGCMCEWPDDCGGTGAMYCDGCGGDLCVCVCGGESECYGCEMCNGDGDYDDYDDARTEATRQQATASAQCGSVTPETPTP